MQFSTMLGAQKVLIKHQAQYSFQFSVHSPSVALHSVIASISSAFYLVLTFTRQNKAIQNHPLTSLIQSSLVIHGPEILSLHLITTHCKAAKLLLSQKSKYNRVFGGQAMIAGCLNSVLIQTISELPLIVLEMAK